MKKSLKVCHIITRLIIGGAQENTLFTCYGLLERGYEVTLLTGPPLGPEGSLLAEARARGLKVVIIPALRRRIDPGRDLLALLDIYRRLLFGNFRIVHTHSAKAGILGRLAAGLLPRRVRIVHSIHGLPFHPYQDRRLNFMYILAEKLVAPVTDLFLSVADAMNRQSLAAGIGRPEKYRTVYSGFAVSSFAGCRALRSAARGRWGFRESDFVIGKVARLFQLKGHDLLLPVFAEARREFPDLRLFLVGDGILKPELEAEAERLGIRPSVVFAGLLPPGEIPEAMAAMDMLVHVSLREGLPRAVSQALAAGLPVAAFDVDGTREVVRSGVTGYLVTPGDRAGLKRAVLEIRRDPDGARRLARTGQAFVLDNFSIERMVSGVAEAYRDLTS
ncbi:MAG TPA: glycosyltransferase family 4 protein [bacterium]|nr:glycosyltransferase family 4 protein [bacterium]HNS48182.1 glycosyltransferase family 4 protein [bacterium]